MGNLPYGSRSEIIWENEFSPHGQNMELRNIFWNIDIRNILISLPLNVCLTSLYSLQMDKIILYIFKALPIFTTIFQPSWPLFYLNQRFIMKWHEMVFIYYIGALLEAKDFLFNTCIEPKCWFLLRHRLCLTICPSVVFDKVKWEILYIKSG